MDIPRFSRPPFAGLFGKCNTRLEVPMSGEMRARLTRLAGFETKPDATWARERLEVAILIEEERVKRIVSAPHSPVNPRKEG